MNNDIFLRLIMSFSTNSTMRSVNPSYCFYCSLTYEFAWFQELKRLIESNTETKEQVEIFHYLDKSSRGEFSKHLIRIIDEIKNIDK